MSIHDLTIEYLSNLSTIRAWPKMQAMLQRAADQKPDDWRLPVFACEAVGGAPEQAIPAVAAIACMQISIILIDDMLDADPRGMHHRIGAPVTANLAAAFQAAGLEAIARSELLQSVKLAVSDSLNQMALKTALGQHLDVQNPADEASYWHLVQTKSSPFFGAALHAGALLGGVSREVAEEIRQFGHIYGEMIQIHDDLNDTMATPANPDWLLGRSPLPILYAQSVNHPARERFLTLRQTVADPDALVEAQKILVRCGAVSYCVDQLLQRYRLAQQHLNAMPLPNRDVLDGLLELVINPVRTLLAAVGVTQIEEIV